MDNASAIAIVGMACRFPGARTVEDFWRNLREGVESIRRLTDDELAAAGVSEAVRRDPGYVPANGVLEDVELFDAGFFGMSPREAEITDPQQRIFLEVAWEALEAAGHAGARDPGRVGVFAGVAMSTYLMHHLLTRPDVVRSVGDLELLMANDKDFVPTRVAYKLNLRGPAVSSNTACSTGLVNVHLACQSLLGFECDMALAGGVSIQVPQARGHLYQPGGVLSPDGHCRAFDARAGGTMSGNGVGIVVLKRLADALADGDHVHAVIVGSAMNNDGSAKAGFTAPSIAGQADVIAQAIGFAAVPVETIRYVEAHGTGTAVGDPIEIAALTRAFRAHTRRTGFCAIGSVKTNVGHLDEAAGVAGLMKAALALEHGQIPPSLHFERPNPEIDFAASPFFVNTRLTSWPDTGDQPRRAGVSSFGLGGTNVHAVLEAAPSAGSGPSRPWQMLALSARTAEELARSGARLADALARGPEPALADAAYTLLAGRRRFGPRRVIVCRDRAEAVAQLRRGDGERGLSGHDEADDRPVVFMFSGHGSQYPGMARGLYASEPAFREALDRCTDVLARHLGPDVGAIIRGDDAHALSAMAVAQPAGFALQYALACLWMSFGVQPAAMMGHSAGEYVAACLAGVLSLEDALRLMAVRGRLIDRTGPGSTLAVEMDEPALLARLPAGVGVAVATAPGMCVVSGPRDAVEALRRELERERVEYRQVDIAVAAHSVLMEPIMGELRDHVARATLKPPDRRFISNITGTWITAADATDPGYWARHLRSTVRLSDGMRELLAAYPTGCFLEVGPGRSLASPLLRHPARTPAQPVLTTLRHAGEDVADEAFLMSTLGRLWLAGVRVDAAAVYAGQARRRVRLPTYPFARQRHWIEPGAPAAAGPAAGTAAPLRQPLDAWFHLPSWRRTLPPAAAATPALRYLVIGGGGGLGRRLAARLRRSPATVTEMAAGAAVEAAALESVDAVVDLRACDDLGPGASGRALFLDLVHLGRTLGAAGRPVRLTVVSTGVLDVSGGEPIDPAKAVILGPVQVIEQEYPDVRCRLIDVVAPGTDVDVLVDRLLAEASTDDRERFVAWRGPYRWCRDFVALPGASSASPPLRQEGVYLITGGVGEVGRIIAGYLARTLRARLILTSRSGTLDAETLARLTGAGAEVMVRAADAADEPAMAAVIAEAVARFGRIDGVIHAAGVTAGEVVFRPVAETTPEQADAVFRPKIEGTRVLERLLRDRPIDFCLLVSSNASTLGGLGFAAYAAASHFLDQFAADCRRRGLPWISSNWDGWPSGASERPSGASERPSGALGSTPRTRMDDYTMTLAEAETAFARVLACDAERVVVAVGDLPARLRRWLEGAKATPALDPGEATRPDHLGDFVEPRTEAERAVAEVFEELLGVRPVGLHDNFFDLGGDSLLGSRALARLSRRFRIELSVRTLFLDPTVVRLAGRVQEALGTTEPEEEEGVV